MNPRKYGSKPQLIITQRIREGLLSASSKPGAKVSAKATFRRPFRGWLARSPDPELSPAIQKGKISSTSLTKYPQHHFTHHHYLTYSLSPNTTTLKLFSVPQISQDGIQRRYVPGFPVSPYFQLVTSPTKSKPLDRRIWHQGVGTLDMIERNGDMYYDGLCDRIQRSARRRLQGQHPSVRH